MRKSFVSLCALAFLVAALAIPFVAFASPPNSATMQFGRPDVGSGCNFPCDDDASFHAVDKIVPGSVAISRGGTVQFNVDGFHQVAIYAADTRPQHIDPDDGSFPFVNDPNNRIFLGGLTTNESFTFNQPGRYLVICNIAPHFEESQMWGWVQVR